MAPIHKTVKLAHYFQICTEENEGGEKGHPRNAFHKLRELEITITDTSKIIVNGIALK